jgi:hypothetical protein
MVLGSSSNMLGFANAQAQNPLAPASPPPPLEEAPPVAAPAAEEEQQTTTTTIIGKITIQISQTEQIIIDLPLKDQNKYKLIPIK